MPYSIAFVGNAAFTMQKFRGEMISFLVQRGHRTFCFAPDYTAETRTAIKALGGVPVDFAHERIGTSVSGAFVSVWDLSRKLREREIDLVFAYFIKPIIVASLAACHAGTPKVYSMIEGRGLIFSDDAPFSLKRWILKFVVSTALVITLRLSDRIFVLNKSDLHFARKLVGRKADRVVQINGIGVDLAYYAPLDEYGAPVRFVFCGRLLRSKGIFDLVDAARQLKTQGFKFEITVIGDVDENQDSVSEAQMVDWSSQGLVDWPGFQNDTRPFFHRYAVLVLPTYYPEGLPRSIQEALSMACPVITTPAPGCGEQIEEGVTGFVVKSHNPDALMRKMRYFVEHPDDIVVMGDAARHYALDHFQSDAINRIVFDDIATAGSDS